jgi:hypothetical protein
MATTKIETLHWLMARRQNGEARIETLGWRRLAHIYHSAKPNSPARRAILAECRRCGYTPSTILALNA